MLRWVALPPHRKQESLLMERRRFLNLAAAATATTALEPATFAANAEMKNPVHYPDPAIEIVDSRFAKHSGLNSPTHLSSSTYRAGRM